MELVVDDSAGAHRRLVLTGRLDAAGTEKVEVAFTAHIRAAQRNALVDMSGVSFVGSLGVRMLIAAARVADRGGCRCLIRIDLDRRGLYLGRLGAARLRRWDTAACQQPRVGGMVGNPGAGPRQDLHGPVRCRAGCWKGRGGGRGGGLVRSR